jgi:hypothetical protein
MWKDGGFRELGNRISPEFDQFLIVVVTDLFLYIFCWKHSLPWCNVSQYLGWRNRRKISFLRLGCMKCILQFLGTGERILRALRRSASCRSGGGCPPKVGQIDPRDKKPEARVIDAVMFISCIEMRRLRYTAISVSFCWAYAWRQVTKERITLWKT